MDHIAILRKSNISKGDSLLEDILTGAKTIESRWYVNRINPWDKIKKGDTVFFKESGSPVTAKANVTKIIQFARLNENTIEEIIKKYGRKISPKTSSKQWSVWAAEQTKKRYCILVFLSNVEKVVPFDINKTGYGISSAWLVVGDINKVRM